ncbi:M24 family metallopeptidase [Selenihalanaerobacter shriftii]|uniref:Xaa-Pro aminopeptidase n=1 Tax=Selenihalanaerobacter shriftii TaxID=142842 RepID=A0A1T4KIK7_9FIRM|nr:aminopeptidase P family N-terminal domain-containing protein [Selenihalanaerobacter shriftii]SJZ42244.1 Xaa-Pro aminopeptidase [Selenihalanaerobacter shriftii]
MSTYQDKKNENSERLADEIRTKEDRVRQLLIEKQLDGIIIGKNHNFAWLTGGGNNRIVNNRETGASELLITKQDKYILTNNLEKNRLREEEVFKQDFTFLSRKWYQNKSLGNLIAGLKLGSDIATKGVEYIGDELARLRYSLLESELERYKELGREVTNMLFEVCQQLKRGVKESEVAGMVAQAVWEIGAYPVSLLVAADERISKYSHPQPTAKEANNRVMISLAVERKGLTVSLTRMVSFQSLSYQLSEQLYHLLEIENIYLEGTKVEQETGELFSKVVNKYKELGYNTEWEFNDHGGALGYKARDYIVTEDSEEEVQVNQPFAWTPTLPGLKLEDTIVATETGPELITYSEEWPMQEYNGWQRPEILIL